MELNYDKYIVAFSGGKDSLACLLELFERGIDRSKIELWHHDIDGKGDLFMDWECTPGYCEAIGKEFGIPVFFSWKMGGFKREMLRENALTAPIQFENEAKEVITVGGKTGKPNTRKRFPQVSPDLSVRWCSSYCKIDVGSCAIRNQERFFGLRVAFISGERGEESPGRAKYAELEPDRADLRDGKKQWRLVDRIRLILHWTEQKVWNIIEKWKIRVHPAYYMGWGRVSCKFCIFGNANQFASAQMISPDQGNEIMKYETEFGITIKRDGTLADLMKKGTPYKAITEELRKIATSAEYKLSVIMDNWFLPAGAFGESCGAV